MDLNETEHVFYKDSTVIVSQSRFIVNGKTYAMRNISSVSNHRIEKSYTNSVMLIFAGIITCLFRAFFLGIILMGIGIAIIIVTKDDYSVQISSNSGESNALTSKDKEYIQKIVNAVNDAMISRG